MRPNRRKPEPEETGDRARIRSAALDLLARREHAATELHDKLVARGWDAGAVDEVVAGLAEAGLQSDARFIKAFVRSRIERGQGPVRIVSELSRRGVTGADADAALVSSGTDWYALAGQVRSRRFGTGVPADWKTRAKQLRFLQQRGFTAAQSRAAMDEESGSA